MNADQGAWGVQGQQETPGNSYCGQLNIFLGNNNLLPASGGLHAHPSGSRPGGPGPSRQVEAEKQEINPQIFSRRARNEPKGRIKSKTLSLAEAQRTQRERPENWNNGILEYWESIWAVFRFLLAMSFELWALSSVAHEPNMVQGGALLKSRLSVTLLPPFLLPE